MGDFAHANHNRGSVLTKGPNSLRQIATGLWCLDSHFVSHGCKASLRMSVIATTGGLVLYSPVRLSGEHVDQIARLGTVLAIIAPNLYHHQFLRECAAIYGSARILIPEGLTEKIGAIDRAEIMSENTVIAPANEIEHFTLTGHTIKESLLYHVPSQTLITADLLYHYTADQFPAERLFFSLIGCYGSPKVAFYHRLSIKEKGSIAELVGRVESWTVRRIVMCHGRIFTDDRAAEVFVAAWRHLARLS